MQTLPAGINPLLGNDQKGDPKRSQRRRRNPAYPGDIILKSGSGLLRNQQECIVLHRLALSILVYSQGVASIFFNTGVVTRITGLTFVQQMLPNFRGLASSIVMDMAVAVLGTVPSPSSTPLKNFWKILTRMSFGARVYIRFAALRWNLSGCPRGPETVVMSLRVKGNQTFVEG